jgi:hypothetical protein
MYSWEVRHRPYGCDGPIVLVMTVSRGIGQSNSFFWTVPVSCLLKKHTPVPVKLKKPNNIHKIEVGLK